MITPTCDPIFITHSNDSYDGSIRYVLLAIICVNILVAIFLFVKMCQLCSQAFSFTNFHIHETYKLYTLAIIAILISTMARFSQIDIVEDKMRLSNFNSGYCYWNELVSILAIYIVNEMYLFNGFTWFMIGNHCDFTQRLMRSVNSEESEQVLIRRRKLTHRVKLIILYILVPGMMMTSTLCILIGAIHQNKFYQYSRFIQVSKALVNISSFITFLLFFYSLVKLIKQRWNDQTTEKKVKVMWIYIVLALSFRIFFFLYQTFDPPIKKADFGMETAYTIFYNVFIFNCPILVLSYLSEKQLQKQRLKWQRTQQESSSTVQFSDHL